MALTWIGKLDGGQLDVMWNFLRFKGEGVSIEEVEYLEKSLDKLRTLMIQKSAGQPNRESKTLGYVEFEDLETVLNCIVVETMCKNLRVASEKGRTSPDNWHNKKFDFHKRIKEE